MKKMKRKLITMSLTAAMVVTALETLPQTADAKAKAEISLSKTSVSLKKGKKITLTLKKKNVKKIASITWSSGKKSVATVSKKGVVTAKKPGNTDVTAKVKYLGKGTAKYQTKTLTCKVKVTAPSDTAPTAEASKIPDVTPVPTAEPAVYGEPGKASAYDRTKSHYTLSVDSSAKEHEISDMLYGIFIEDINFAADGGLYAEMVQNRSFEFTKLASGNEKHAWSDVGKVNAEVVTDDTASCLNANNPNYMKIVNSSAEDAGISNVGFLDGMSITKDAKYKFSVWAKGIDGYTGPVNVSIMNGTQPAAEGTIPAVTAEWKKYELELTSSVTAYSTVSNKSVTLQVTIPKGSIAVDMVSLFPADTFKGRANGLRRDLAERLEALHPAFLRFPGGCVIEGDTLQTAYDWKDSIGVGADGEPLEFNGAYGDVAARKMGQNIWTNEKATNDPNPVYMSYGLGFYEYFLLAEDIGAIGVPIVNCGLSCMVANPGQAAAPAVDSPEFKQYVQDALDLVEFCRGDENTKWGKVRASMGHPEKFALKYVGIGNEQWGNKFYTRYAAFVDAFDEAKKKNPEIYGDIELMFSAGVDDGDSGRDYMPSYVYASNWLKSHPGKTLADFAGVTDHHYYNIPDWFYEHTDYYDPENYSRDVEHMTTSKFGGGLDVFLGEYASLSNTWNSALSEAAYMTGLERNGDIIKMAAYAPLFGNTTATHWAPDLIWFNNHTVTNSVNYYVQQAFAKNAGTSLLKSQLEGAVIKPSEFIGKVGLGTWETSAKFDNVKVTDNDTGALLAADDFSVDDLSLNWTKVADGSWKIKNGKLIQSSTSTNTNSYGNTGTTMYYGNSSWKNYTFTVDATKTGGGEGFLIPFAVSDKENNYFWNIGGWGNSVSCLQKVTSGTKSDQLAGTVKNCSLETGKTYKLKVAVNGCNVKCYINNELYVDYTVKETARAESYHVVSTDETGDIIIKMVNVTGYPKTFAIDIQGTDTVGQTAALDLVAGNSLADDNILGQQEAVTLKSSEVDGISKQFNYTVPKYSVAILRVKTK